MDVDCSVTFYLSGNDGRDGRNGVTGATGQAGRLGRTGATGQKGSSGNTGATGQSALDITRDYLDLTVHSYKSCLTNFITVYLTRFHVFI